MKRGYATVNADFRKIESQTRVIKSALEWLCEKNYLQLLPRISAWDDEMYRLNWKTIKKALNIDPPPELKPVSTEEFVKIQWRKVFEAFEARRGEE